MRNAAIRMVSSVLLSGFCSYAASQDIVYRDLAAKGVKPLSGEEVKKTLAGARLITEWGSNKLSLQFDADGSVGGWVESARGNSGVTGTWTVNDKHQYCWEIKVTATGTPGNSCRRLFRAGDDLYTAVSGQGYDAMMRKLEFAK